jgi:RimJ/RimL family protein N-acetyltransferase
MIPGRRVHLRPIEVEDLPFLRDLMNHPAVAGLVVGWGFPVSLHDQERWLAASVQDPTTRRLIVVDSASDAPVGLTGLWDIDWHNQGALSATKLHPDQIGAGMGTDAIMTTLAWAFHVVGLRRLHSAILDFNGPSLGAYVRHCGWRIEGQERESIFRKGQWCDLYRVAILRDDFDALDAAAEYVERICPFDMSTKVDLQRLQRDDS